ncbi:MAG: GAF domain-containing protein, partial [Candidatus Rokubacteria bacterium]|nr:GAF domain-containing protein [Candidatus Rokubacteria bacterium]
MTPGGSRLRQVAELARSVAGALELGTVLRHVIAAVEELRPRGVWVNIRLVDAEAGGFRLAASGGEAVQTAVPVIPFGPSLTQTVAQTRKPLLVTDALADPRVHRWADARFPVYYGVPIEAGGTVFGVLNVACPAGAPLTDEEQEIIDVLAGHTAVALRNAAVLAESEARRRAAEAMADVARGLSQTLDPDAIGQRIADTLLPLLGVRASGLYRLDPASGDLIAVAATGDVGPTPARGLVFRRGTGTVGVAVRERQPVVTADVLSDPRIALDAEQRRRVEQTGYRAVLAVPLIANERVIGALWVGDRAGRVFSDDDRRFAETFAAQAAVALENTRLFALEIARRRQLEALSEIERELAAELNTDALLRLVVERAARLFAGNGTIYMAEGDGLTPRAWTDTGTFPDVSPRVGEAVVGRSAEQRRGLIVNDYATSSWAVPQYLAIGVTRVMASPLLLRDRLLGVISMNRIGETAPPFSADDLAGLERFATQAAVALRNAALYEDAQRRRGEAEELARVARSLTSSLDLRAVAERVVQSVLPLFGAAGATLRLVQADGSLLAVAIAGRSAEHFGASHVFPPRAGVAGRAVTEGRPVWVRDICSDPTVELPEDVRRRVAGSGLGAVLAVPLRAKGEIVGALTVVDRIDREFLSTEIDLLQAFGDQAALALENARLYESREARAVRLRTLARLNQIISASLDVDEVLAGIARAAADLMNAPLVAIRIADEAARTLHLRAFSDAAMGSDHPAPARRYGEGVTGWVAIHRIAVNIPDLFADDRGEAHDWFRSHGLRSVVCVPILFQESLLGIITLYGREPFRHTADDRDLLDGFVAQAGVAIRNARLYTGQQERASRLRTLARLNQLVSSSLDMRQVLAGIARAAAEIISAPFVSFWLVDPATRTLSVGAVSDDAMWHDYPLAALSFAQGGVIGEVAARGRAIEIADVFADRRILAPTWFAKHGFSSYVGLPITFQDTVLAVLNLNGRAPFRFSEADFDLLEIFAAQAAVAIRNARLYEELRVAHERLEHSQDQLVQTERLRALGEMAAGVAHEINNPIGVISMFAQLLSEESKEKAPESYEKLRTIEQQAEHVGSIVKDLLR